MIELVRGDRHGAADQALRDARGEVIYAAEFFRWYAEEAVRIDGAVTTAPSGANRIIVVRQPVGRRSGHPAELPWRPWRPADQPRQAVDRARSLRRRPRCAFAVADILREAVLHGVVNVVCTQKAGPLVGAMLADPRVRKLSFTGSTEVGRVLLDAAQTITNCSMNSAHVRPDLRLRRPRRGASGASLDAQRRRGLHRGQPVLRAPGGGRRVHLRFADRLSKLAVGPAHAGTDLGLLVKEDTVEVASLVDSATTGGAQVVTGGRAPDRKGDNFLQLHPRRGPPLMVAILGTEIFGRGYPRRFDEDDAIRPATTPSTGWSRQLFTADLRRALRVSEALDTGMVGVNRGIGVRPGRPVRRRQAVRPGREGGHDGLLEFTESKYIAVDW